LYVLERKTEKKKINTAITCIENPSSGKTTQGIPKLAPMLEYGYSKLEKTQTSTTTTVWGTFWMEV